jgi:hypothetical protein
VAQSGNGVGVEPDFCSPPRGGAKPKTEKDDEAKENEENGKQKEERRQKEARERKEVKRWKTPKRVNRKSGRDSASIGI